jgi:hypothetical protein
MGVLGSPKSRRKGEKAKREKIRIQRSEPRASRAELFSNLCGPFINPESPEKRMEMARKSI